MTSQIVSKFNGWMVKSSNLAGHFLAKNALLKKIDFLKLLEKLKNAKSLGGSDKTNAL